MISDNDLQKSSEDYGVSFNQVKTKLLFAGKSLEQWCTEFNFVIKDEADFKDLIEISQTIDSLTSVAHNNSGIARNTYNLLKRGREKKSVRAYTKMMADAQRRPSVVEGENRIALQCEDEDDKLTIAKAFVDFWEEQIKLLDKRSKLCDSIFWSMKSDKGLGQ